MYDIKWSFVRSDQIPNWEKLVGCATGFLVYLLVTAEILLVALYFDKSVSVSQQSSSAPSTSHNRLIFGMIYFTLSSILINE